MSSPGETTTLDSISSHVHIAQHEQHILSTSFKDPGLEKRFRSFYRREHLNRFRGITLFLLFLACAFLARAHSSSAPASELLCFYVLISSMISGLVLVTCFKPSSNALHLIATICECVGQIATAYSLALTTAESRKTCGHRDVDCLIGVSDFVGFAVGSSYALLLVVATQTIFKFEFFCFAVVHLNAVFLFFYLYVEPLTGDCPTYMCIVFFFFTGLVLYWNRSTNNSFRRDYLWFVGTLQLSDQHIAQVELEQMHKRRVVGYLFHEIRNPINNIVLATNACVTFLKEALGDTILAQGSLSDPKHQAWKEVSEMVEIVSDSAVAASHVLDDALTLERLQAGNFVFALEPFRFAEDLCGTVTRAIRPQMQKAQLQFDVMMPDELENVWVIGDLKRLQQVLHNLLSNACKFTKPKGQVVVRAELVNFDENVRERIRESSGRVQIRVSVSDSGAGIALDDQHKLFQPWSQIQAATLQKGGGTGLGLSLSKDFVERGHNGTIGMISPGDLGCGSTFFFSIEFQLTTPKTLVLTPQIEKRLRTPRRALPSTSSGRTSGMGSRSPSPTSSSRRSAFDAPFDVGFSTPELVHQGTVMEHLRSPLQSTRALSPGLNDEGDDEDDDSNDNNRDEREAELIVTQSEDSARSPLRVLVVDDSAVTCKLVCKALTKLGVIVMAAQNGQVAVDMILSQGKSFDLILMDKEMPEMDGHQATALLRKNGVTSAIIGVTGNAMDDQRLSFIQAGATQVIPKPISNAQLAKLIEDYSTTWT